MCDSHAGHYTSFNLEGNQQLGEHTVAMAAVSALHHTISKPRSMARRASGQRARPPFNSGSRRPAACVRTPRNERLSSQKQKHSPFILHFIGSLRLTMGATHHHSQRAAVRRRVSLAHRAAPCEAGHRGSLPDGCRAPDRSRRDHESGRLGDERHEACHESEGTRHRGLLVLYRSLSF